jgi:hypothetical protein
MRRIEVTRSFMGRYEPNGFIVVHFVVDEGGEDAVGFSVRRLPLWVADIVKSARPHLKAIQGSKVESPGGEPATGTEEGAAEAPERRDDGPGGAAGGDAEKRDDAGPTGAG